MISIKIIIIINNHNHLIHTPILTIGRDQKTMKEKDFRYHGFPYQCLGPSTVIQMEDDIDLPLRSQKWWVAGINEKASINQGELTVCCFHQFIWEGVYHCV